MWEDLLEREKMSQVGSDGVRREEPCLCDRPRGQWPRWLAFSVFVRKDGGGAGRGTGSGMSDGVESGLSVYLQVRCSLGFVGN